MFDILKGDTELSKELKAMDDNDFFKAILAHSIVKVYEGLGEQVEKKNEQSNGIYTFNLFIPESMNIFVENVLGKDTSSELGILCIGDGYLSGKAIHDLKELALAGGYTTQGYKDVFLELINQDIRYGINNCHDDKIAHIIANGCRQNHYNVSQARLDSLKEYDECGENAYDYYGIEESLELKLRETSKQNLIKMSSDFLQEFGLLRKHVEIGITSIQTPIIQVMSKHAHRINGMDLDGFTTIEFKGAEGNKHLIIFNEEKALITTSGDYYKLYGDYKIVSLDGKNSLEIDGIQYEASLGGIKTLEMDHFDNQSFTIIGKIDYLNHEDEKEEASSKVRSKMKP
ncbi:hypothetical protein SOX05_08715 [Pseudomonas putida]|nr:hypothetical protein [Pseudomonas putida]MDY4319343.1 hypothetical protein [Pseudomonas putida]MDY4352728.1 hypothetical protein [Pseudomonas putida]